MTTAQRPQPSIPSPYKTAMAQLDAAADLLGLDDGMRRLLRSTKRELTVSVPVKMEDRKSVV